MASEFVESALVSSVFHHRNKPDVVEQLLEVDPEWLEGTTQKALVCAMRSIAMEGGQIIEATILGALKASGELGPDCVYWPAYQEALSATEPQPVGPLIADLKDDYQRRTLTKLLAEKQAELQDTSKPVIELAGSIPEGIDAILANGNAEVDVWGKVVEKAAAGEELKDYVRQGAYLFPEVNEIYRTPRSAMTYVVARLNVGKSILGDTYAFHTVSKGERIVFVNQDMPSAMAQVKLLSCFSGVPQWRIEKGKTSDADRRAIREAGDLLKGYVTFLHFPGMTVLDKMRPKVIQAVRKAKATAIVWDQFSQIGKDPKVAKNEISQAVHISRSLKNLAASLDVALIMLAQANRGAAQGEPGVNEIAETDAIGQDACGIFTLWPDESRAKTAEANDLDFGGPKTSDKWKNVPYVSMRLAKSQIGPAGEVWHLFRDGERNRFRIDERQT